MRALERALTRLPAVSIVARSRGHGPAAEIATASLIDLRPWRHFIVQVALECLVVHGQRRGCVNPRVGLSMSSRPNLSTSEAETSNALGRSALARSPKPASRGIGDEASGAARDGNSCMVAGGDRLRVTSCPASKYRTSTTGGGPDRNDLVSPKQRHGSQPRSPLFQFADRCRTCRSVRNSRRFRSDVGRTR